MGMGRNFWRSCSSASLLHQVSQDCVQAGFDYLQRSRIHNHSGQHIPWEHVCHSHRKKLFLIYRWQFLCFSLCLLPLVLSLGTNEENLVPSSWHLSVRHLYALVRFPLSCLFSRLNRPNSLSLREMFLFPNHLQSPLLAPLPHLLFLDWGAQNWT